ncbi:hypothetical protein [Ornithinimicrobium cerasi]|uniref:hypothetical protein n=1 Tax=Ornithinimicrobium cerasi TaxID=2248773 RepID=UPI000EFF65FC|nr:hypothetical protein [Ornithinimicrobium cerasi]
MAGFKFNDEEMRKLQRQVEAKTEPASAEANRAAQRHDTAEGRAKAYADVMQRHGITMDKAGLVKRFRALMGEQGVVRAWTP